MQELEHHFRQDVERIQALDIVPAILELICRTTGMGFSAVARVTEDRWIACAVRDEIDFGLIPGGELRIETTICNEIRGHGQPVVIDEVSGDTQYCDHPTPGMYGFQSYISIPIILKDGTFFGTLCAIDPNPFPLKARKMVTMFNLFADLISYHLQTQDQLRLKNALLQVTETKLQDSLDDIRQYTHISRHALQEPLRKLRLLSDMIMVDRSLPADHKARTLATRIHKIAGNFRDMIHQLTEFSETTNVPEDYTLVDLNGVAATVLNRLRLKILEKGAMVKVDLLHTISGIPRQLYQVFYFLLDNALNFSRLDVAPVIKIYSVDVEETELRSFGLQTTHSSYCKICFTDNGIGMESGHLEQIFDLFVRLNREERFDGLGMGLSQAKRIMRNHEGFILVTSKLNEGSTFSLVFPMLPLC